jgi:PPP family 3-phenylpropionic acid transporter
MSVALRLGLYYAAIFIGNGASGPYASVWFRAHGLSGAAIGLILAAPAFGRAFTGPVAAIWADGFALRRTPLSLMAAALALAYAALAFGRGFWAWLVLWFAAQSLYANLSPLADVIALRQARIEGFNYGWPRGIGSAAYVVGNVGMGAVLGLAPPDALIVWIVASALAAAVAARWLLPPDKVRERGGAVAEEPALQRLRRLLRDPVFILAIVACGLIQASHGFYYGFSALVWRAQGIAPAFVGLLWGVGVAAEVAFLWFGEPLRRRLGPERLILVGGAGAVARWTCLAFSPPLWLLWPIQLLHALTFTATFVGSLQLMERLAPPGAASLAQTLNSVLSGGFLIGLATLASGRLFDAVGAQGYFGMSLIAVAGLLGASLLAVLPAARRRAVVVKPA